VVNSDNDDMKQLKYLLSAIIDSALVLVLAGCMPVVTETVLPAPETVTETIVVTVEPRLENVLADKLAAMTAGQTISVGIWLRVPDPPREVLREVDKQQKYEAFKESFVKRFIAFLASEGYQPSYVSIVAPVMWVELPKSLILEIAIRPDVDRVYWNHDDYSY